jgi:hypothetical protein
MLRRDPQTAQIDARERQCRREAAAKAVIVFFFSFRFDDVFYTAYFEWSDAILSPIVVGGTTQS